jgi:hypothetical protein
MSRICLGPSGNQLSSWLVLLGFLPMHCDFLRFVRVASSVKAFTAITRVRIPSEISNRFNDFANPLGIRRDHFGDQLSSVYPPAKHSSLGER